MLFSLLYVLIIMHNNTEQALKHHSADAVTQNVHKCFQYVMPIKEDQW